MNKSVSIFALLSVVFLLVSCTSAQTGEPKPVESPETKKKWKESATEYAEILLSAILTSDDDGFSRVYGKTYNQWTEAELSQKKPKRLSRIMGGLQKRIIRLSFWKILTE